MFSPGHGTPSSRRSPPFGLLEICATAGQVHLGIGDPCGKISPWTHVRRLKFFEQRDADFQDDGAQVQPVPVAGAVWYEDRLCSFQPRNILFSGGGATTRHK